MEPLPNIQEIITKAKQQARRETDSEPEPSLTGEFEWPAPCEVKPGLDGAIACTTKIGYVNGSKGWLIYCGIDIFDLCENSSFEETAYLLLFGNLPTRSEFDAFESKLRTYRSVPSEIIDQIKNLRSYQPHPMASLQTAVSMLGDMDPTADDPSVEAETEVAIKLTAQMTTLVGAIARIRAGAEPLAPDPDLPLGADLVRMMTGKTPSPEDARVMDIALILHADHGMNASTFTTMVINSSLSDMYSSVAGGIGSLKGPLHGGANEAVLEDLREIGAPDKVDEWYEEARKTKRKVMGFGHRVYKAYDPRARILEPMADLLSNRSPENRQLYETAVVLEKKVVEELGATKSIFPNVDFYSGIVYDAMGIESAMFTPIFAASRIAGWTARTLEYLKDNRIFRPRAIYVGPLHVDHEPIEERG